MSRREGRSAHRAPFPGSPSSPPDGSACSPRSELFWWQIVLEGLVRCLFRRRSGRAMEWFRPESYVPQDLLYHCIIMDQGDDSHLATTPRTHQRVHFPHLFDQIPPSLVLSGSNLEVTTYFYVAGKDSGIRTRRSRKPQRSQQSSPFRGFDLQAWAKTRPSLHR